MPWSGRTEKPSKEHPQRPVQGLACPKTEVSGARLWGWAQLVGDALAETAGKDGLAHLTSDGVPQPAVVGTPAAVFDAGPTELSKPVPPSPSALAFFSKAFVYSYCPLAFMAASGRNVVPEKLSAADRGPMLEACAGTFREVVAAVKPKYIVGIGKWAEARAHDALDGRSEFEGIEIISIIHPSPANPAAHKDWGGNISRQMIAAGCHFHCLPGLPWAPPSDGATPRSAAASAEPTTSGFPGTSDRVSFAPKLLSKGKVVAKEKVISAGRAKAPSRRSRGSGPPKRGRPEPLDADASATVAKRRSNRPREASKPSRS